jgi:CelD/BcsL family acetyltransferase involved in cellulose biosynthesis
MNDFSASARPVATVSAAPESKRDGGYAWPSGTAVVSAGDGWVVAVVRQQSGFDAFEAEWEDLARTAAEPNVFYEPWYMRAAALMYPGFPDLRIAFVFAIAPVVAPGQRLLCGVFPFQLKSELLRLPVRHVALWRHPFSVLGTPLVRQGHEAETIRAVFSWLRDDRQIPRIAVFERMAGDGPVYQALLDFLRRESRPNFIVDAFTRALLRPAEDFETYLRRASVHKVHTKARRKWRRLEERGHPVFEHLVATDDIEPWIAEFLRVESSGWKGRGGSALASDSGRRAYFETACREAHRRGRLMMMRLRVNDATIATRCTFTAGDGAFSFKIGCDDAYREFGPGVLLAIENIRAVHEGGHLAWMDSCAVPDSAMISRLWTDRRTIVSVAVGTGKALGDLIVSALPLVRWAWRALGRRRTVASPPDPRTLD